MFRFVGVGLLASLFFSIGWITIRLASIEGGHWVWTASLIYAFAIFYLAVYLLFKSGFGYLISVLKILKRHWIFWLITGTIGAGLLDAPICFAATYAPAWVMAASFQLSALITFLVLIGFGKKVPLKAVLLSSIIFIGVLLIQLGQVTTINIKETLFGFLPMLIAACAYPLSNQLVGVAMWQGYKKVPHIVDPVMSNAGARALLMFLGSIPFFVLLLLSVNFVSSVPAPSLTQLVATAIISLFSVVLGTAVFFYIRHQAKKTYEIATVEATIAGDPLFSLFGEVVFLSCALPTFTGTLGIVLVVIGFVIYSIREASQETT